MPAKRTASSSRKPAKPSRKALPHSAPKPRKRVVAPKRAAPAVRLPRNLLNLARIPVLGMKSQYSPVGAVCDPGENICMSPQFLPDLRVLELADARLAAKARAALERLCEDIGDAWNQANASLGETLGPEYGAGLGADPDGSFVCVRRR